MSLPLIIAAALIGQTGYDAAVAAAKADYNAAALNGVYTQRYLFTGALPAGKRPAAEVALKFWLPHLSRTRVIEQAIPVRIAQDTYRIDLDSLGWGRSGWEQLAKEYPYSHAHDPLVMRGDWLLRITSDAADSEAYFFLLYGNKPPKNKDEFWAIWNVDPKAKDASGIVLDEGTSGVSIRTRLIKFTPSKNVHAWETFDTRVGIGEADAMEQLGGTVKADAQEVIIGSEVFSKVSGKTGLVNRYWLNDGKGVKQNAAPIDIVIDHKSFLGQPDIRVPGSCVGCHAPTNLPATNTPRVWVADGILVSKKSKAEQEAIDAFYFREHGVRHARAAEDFLQFTTDACGCSPSAAVADWNSTIHAYDGKVSLAQAAIETYAQDAQELRQAIGYYSERIGPQYGVGRLVSLAHGFPVSRAQFEGSRKLKVVGIHELAAASLAAWRAAK